MERRAEQFAVINHIPQLTNIPTCIHHRCGDRDLTFHLTPTSFLPTEIFPFVLLLSHCTIVPLHFQSACQSSNPKFSLFRFLTKTHLQLVFWPAWEPLDKAAVFVTHFASKPTAPKYPKPPSKHLFTPLSNQKIFQALRPPEARKPPGPGGIPLITCPDLAPLSYFPWPSLHLS